MNRPNLRQLKEELEKETKQKVENLPELELLRTIVTEVQNNLHHKHNYKETYNRLKNEHYKNRPNNNKQSWQSILEQHIKPIKHENWKSDVRLETLTKIYTFRGRVK